VGPVSDPTEETPVPFFTSHDGTRLAYEDYDLGGGTGAPIVFVASWALNSDMWEYQIPYFVERGYRCITLDRRGHGRSDRPSTGYDVDTTTDDLAALLEHLDLFDATLVGHSFGGAEVARYLARHGERRVAEAAFVSAVLPFLKQTDDNPNGLPEGALEATIAQLRTTARSGSRGRPRSGSPPTWATTSPPRSSTTRWRSASRPHPGRPPS
jgi:non-heme chloroperoxidase